MPELHFTEQYLEAATLRDGSRIELRLVRPEDKRLFLAGWQRMSPSSRYRRFLGAKNHLSEADLAYLTEFDGKNHLAIGAVVRRPDGTEEGIGVARFVRSSSDPSIAEAAVAVIDDWQNRGAGTLLLLRLAAAARERGIARFTGTALAQNLPIRDILRQLGPALRTTMNADEISFDVEVPVVPAKAGPKWPGPKAALGKLLSLTATSALRLRPPPARGCS